MGLARLIDVGSDPAWVIAMGRGHAIRCDDRLLADGVATAAMRARCKSVADHSSNENKRSSMERFGLRGRTPAERIAGRLCLGGGQLPWMVRN